jgi:RNA polymerase sigma-70 factor (ECF subfamily)
VVVDTASSETRLVKRMLAGDQEAFEAFFADHFPSLFRFALVRAGNDSFIADEVVQSTFCKAFDNLDRFRGEASLLTWLCRICRNELISYYRRSRRRPQLVELAEERPEIRSALELLSEAEPVSPETRLRQKEVARWVQVTLDSLPARYGRALEWKYIHGLSVREIGERLDLSTKAAESLLTRARQAFRQGFKTFTSGDLAWTEVSF